MRRVLLVSPGHEWSTYDVHTGLHGGFRAIGVESYPYALEERIPAARDWLRFMRGRNGQDDGEDVARADLVCVASQESVIKALAVGADAVVVVSGLLYDPRLYVLLGRAGIPTFVYGTESPYNDQFYQRIVPSTAAFSTNEATSVPVLQAAVDDAGADTCVMHLSLGYNPDRHHPGVGDDIPITSHDVVFAGNVYPSRQAMLEGVDWAGVDLGLYGVFVSMDKDSPLWMHVCGGATPSDPFRAVDNRAVAALYSRAKITLNLFRTEEYGNSWDDITVVDGGESINPRMIEAAACGAFMLSEYRPEVEHVFGDLVPTFKTPGELQQLVRHYLDHEDERRAIEAKLPEAVAEYSYHHRARQIVDVLNSIRERVRPAA